MIENECCLRPGVSFEVKREEFSVGLTEKERLALEIAAEIHKEDIRRTTGEPYVNHCMAVAQILRQWGADEEMVIAGLLHDTWEDHPELISLEQIRDMFGERVALLVDGVSKFKSPTGKDNDFETLRKVTRETLVEPGVAMIKLADRLHNMHTMEDGPKGKGFSEEKKMAKAKETLAVYVPMAESLGLWQVKNALADISFYYLEPERYKQVKEKIDSDPRLEKNFIEGTEKAIATALIEAGIAAEVKHEVGGYWELAEKQKRSAMRADSKPKEFADITDVVSFRVIIKDEENLAQCYLAMGVIRNKYKNLLVQNRSDDYLVKPAVNGYSAFHDTYKVNEGNIEVAFTTRKRENFNNWGVASIGQEELMKDPDSYKRKMIFTPKEELVFMEPGATGIDVAYKLNPLLGLRAVAIKVNGEVISLDKIIPNAGVVEVITDQHQTYPNVDWLGFCNPETRNTIEQQMRIAEHDQEVNRGKEILVNQVLKERGILAIEDLDQDVVDKLLVDLGCWFGIDDLYYKVAYGLDPEVVSKKLDEMKIGRGMFTTILVQGRNRIGVSEEIAGIIAKHKGDERSKVEKVNREENFMIRVLITVDYQGKKEIERELRERKFTSCMVV
ncbi:MAG TPA: HD domain-containing protein [Candidatus Woesebacteria bacterium]|nr:HD domain-containing protein [Candidatus Woesebacteria bacterium]